jgi:hypothetical protein
MLCRRSEATQQPVLRFQIGERECRHQPKDQRRRDRLTSCRLRDAKRERIVAGPRSSVHLL